MRSIPHTPQGDGQPAWLLGLSVLDLAAISFSASISGGFNSPYFPAYYFAVAVAAYVFTSPRLVLPWTTLVAVVYSVLSFTVEPALGLAAKEEQHLFYRLVALYAVSAAVSIISGLERESRRKGLGAGAGTTAAGAGVAAPAHRALADHPRHHGPVGLHGQPGGRGAMELVYESNEELRAKLRLVAELSRSAMWELRHPIDGGQIFRGRGAGRCPGGPRRHLHRHHLGAGGAGAAGPGTSSVDH